MGRDQFVTGRGNERTDARGFGTSRPKWAEAAEEQYEKPRKEDVTRDIGKLEKTEQSI